MTENVCCCRLCNGMHEGNTIECDHNDTQNAILLNIELPHPGGTFHRGTHILHIATITHPLAYLQHPTPTTEVHIHNRGSTHRSISESSNETYNCFMIHFPNMPSPGPQRKHPLKEEVLREVASITGTHLFGS